MTSYSKEAILALINKSSGRPNFLDFLPPERYVKGLAIGSREQAIEKALNLNDLNSIVGVQGLPPFQVLRDVLDELSDLNALPILEGTGIELGAGLALLSIAFLERDLNREIKGIVALEAVKPFVEKGIQKAGAQILGERSCCLLPCYGIFEEIPVEDQTFDFALQIESLHHAENLDNAVRELSRILKKGGVIVSFDRSWENSTRPEVLEELLDHEYSKDWLKTKHFAHEKKFTRRDNGEHEYTDNDWIQTFKKHDLSLIKLVHLHPKVETWHVKKRIASLLHISRLLGIKINSRPGVIRGWIGQKIGKGSRIHSNLLVSPHPRPLTMFVFKRG